ncbi:MAG: hypothetical protein DWQ04_06595, partial [Chloroflexi bacterium]
MQKLSPVQQMNASGIGLAGIDGVWWLPAQTPFFLPPAVNNELNAFGHAVFVFLDAVMALFHHRTDDRMRQLLMYKVPEQLQKFVGNGRVLSLRPDFQLRPFPSGQYQPVVTELEICPSAHGFAHAMQAGYGLKTDLVDSFARFLNGRPLLFVSTAQWSEFLFEQLSFCRALAEVGAQGRVLFDVSIATLADDVSRGQRWQPPIFGIKTKPDHWHDDLIARIQAHNFEKYLWNPESLTRHPPLPTLHSPLSTCWPKELANAVVFRFGYCDCFAPDKLTYFAKWQERGATLLNPASFIWDSKVVMALLQETAVRQHLPPDVLTILDRCIPETVLLQTPYPTSLLAEKDAWIIKYAGFDGDNQAWGGRSLQVGAAHSAASWRQVLDEVAAMPWPVVAQKAVPSVQVDIEYLDRAGNMEVMKNG